MKHGPIAALIASRGELGAGNGPSGGGTHGSYFAPESGCCATNRTKAMLAGKHLLRVRA